MARSSVAARIGLVGIAIVVVACARPTIRNTRVPVAQPSRATPMMQLWIEPKDLPRRDLLWGAARKADAPATGLSYTVERRDASGYSSGYDVVGPDGRRWDIKVGDEAQPEVVLSRILWAIGYHQPATYYVTGWLLSGSWDYEGQPARFRLQSDHTTEGEWMWLENPFSGSRPLNGLIAVNLLLNNFDLKDSNTRVYHVRDRRTEPALRYVVQDVGASLGKSRGFPIPIGSRNHLKDFESIDLIKEVRGSEVILDYRGPNRDVLEQIRVADVIWACELMNRLSDAQLDDAFEAAAYPPDVRERFVRKIRAKIREGLGLRQARAAGPGAVE